MRTSWLKLFTLTLLLPGYVRAEWQCQGPCVEVTPTIAATATRTASPTPTVVFTSTATPLPTLTPSATVSPIRTIVFQESQALFSNPGVGFQTTRKTKNQVSNPRAIPLTHATFRTCMNQMNPSAGVFDWGEIDSFLTAAAAQGQTVQLGAIAYDPYDCGGWLRNNIPSVQVFCSTENPGRSYYAPDWNTAAAQGAHRSFVQAFANKYNNDPRVDSIDVRSIGDYGEWHHSCLKNKATGQPHPMPSEAARRIIIKDYHDYFTNKPLIHILDDSISRQEAVTRGAGWRADCWGGHHEDDLYPGWLASPVDMFALWQRGQVSLEPCGSQTSTSYMSIMRKVDEAIEKHASLINTKNDIAFSDSQWPEWQRLLKKLGYRFVVRKAYIADGTGFDVENVGIAPNYKPIDFKYAGQTIQIAERILPGTIKFFRFDARSGTLTASMDGKVVRLANTEWNNGIVIP